MLYRALLATLLLLPALASAQDRYFPFAIDQDRLSGPVDFSQLNTPITPSLRIAAHGGHFVTVGADGRAGTADDKPIRFFGVNLAFGGNFPEVKDAVRVAKRLRRLGVNLVRLHHMDTSPDEQPTRARSILTTGPYPTFNPVSMHRLRKLLDAFRAEGIYVNLNLHVGYAFRPAIDRVPAMPDGVAMPTHGKPLHIFHPRMVELQEIFTSRLLRELKLSRDPVLAMVEINNESSMLWAWQRSQLSNAAQGEYAAELQRQWNLFLRSKYQTTDAVAAAWKMSAAVPPLPALGAIPLVPEKTTEPVAMVDDYLEFLVAVDRTYLNRLRDVIRKETGPLVPITGTQVGFGGPLTFDSHCDLDYIDEHFYVDHYNFPGRSWDNTDWRIRDASAIGENWLRFFQSGAVRQTGKPFTLSEYNQQWPNRQGHEIDPSLAAFASMQDWDGLMHFAYAHAPAWDNHVPSGFDLNSDLSKLVTFGQAALLFRERLLQPARQQVSLPFPREWRMQAARAGKIREMPDYLGQMLGVNTYVLFRHRVSVDPNLAPDALKVPPAEGIETRIDTGEIGYLPGKRISLIDAPRIAGIIGYVDRDVVEAGPLRVKLAPSARGFATLLLHSLDDRPIAESARLLLSNPGYTMGSVPGSNPPVPQKMVHYPGTADWWTLEAPAGQAAPSGARSGGTEPLWMERVECTVTLRLPASSIEVYPLDGTGKRRQMLLADSVRKIESGFTIHLQAQGDAPSPWYEVMVKR
jgi:hypothetical protein